MSTVDVCMAEVERLRPELNTTSFCVGESPSASIPGLDRDLCADDVISRICGIRDIRLGFMAKYSSPTVGSSNSGGERAAAFMAAVEWLNADPSHICPISDSGRCDASVRVRVSPHPMDASNVRGNRVWALQNADVLYSPAPQRDVDVIIASTGSNTATTINMMAQIHGKPIIGTSATSDRLSDKAEFPFFSRVVLEDSHQGPYLATLVKHLGWTHIGILAGEGPYALGFATAFAARCTIVGVTVEERHIFEQGNHFDSAQVRLLLTTMLSAGVKVIMLASAAHAETAAILREARALNMTGGAFTWVGADGWMSPTAFKSADPEVLLAADGAIGIFPYTATPSSTSSPGSYEWMSHVAEEQIYGAGAEMGWRATAAMVDPSWDIPVFDAPYNPWGKYVFDATIHVARAAARATDSCFADGECLQDAIRNHTTAGATGDLQLDFATGNRVATGDYVILNIQRDHPDILVPVGSIYGGVVRFDATKVRWPGGVIGGPIPTDGWPDAQQPQSASESASEMASTLAVTTAAVVLIVLVAGLVFVRTRNNQAKVAPDWTFPEPDRFERDPAMLTLKYKLGSGQFGIVVLGLLKTRSRAGANQRELLVAVKQCSVENPTPAQKNEFLEEGDLMKPFNHPSVVRLIGVITQSEPMMLITEFMPRGDLNKFLKSARTQQMLSTEELSEQQLVQFNIDIIQGLSYLAQNGFVHRDIAGELSLALFSPRDLPLALSAVFL